MSKTATPHLPFLADPSSAPRLPKTESSQIYDSSRQRPRQSDSVRLVRYWPMRTDAECVCLGAPAVTLESLLAHQATGAAGSQTAARGHRRVIWRRAQRFSLGCPWIPPVATDVSIGHCC